MWSSGCKLSGGCIGLCIREVDCPTDTGGAGMDPARSLQHSTACQGANQNQLPKYALKMILHPDNSSTDRYIFCGESKGREILLLLLEQPFETNNGKNNGLKGIPTKSMLTRHAFCRN
jgi:hypothetical protein